MTNKTILREIHRENKSINRNLQRLAKTGLILVAVSEIVLMIADIIDYREEKIEQQLEEDDG